MKLPSRLLTTLLVAMLAAGLVIAWWWSSLASKTNAGDRVEIDVASFENHTTSWDNESLPNLAASKPAKKVVQKLDVLLESLRSKLEARNVVPGEALLTFRSREALDRFAKQAGAYGLDVLGTIPELNTARVHYGQLERLRDSIAATSADLASVEGNLWLGIPGTTSPQPDPNNQGGRAPFGQSTMSAINAAGDRTHWGDGVTVAVLDTGVLVHPTFAQGQVTHLDLVNDGQTFDSHGTSVASIIGGQNPQAPGVAPGAQILDVRVANADGYSVSSTLAQGIITATDSGAKVINISLGGYGNSPILEQAVTYAFQRGVVVVAAAGNDAYGQLAIPAAYADVISVGSVDANNRQAYFSNAGAGLDMAAPGVGVVSAWGTDQIALVSGTSQSSALVAGAATTYLTWGVPSNQVAVRLKIDARPALNDAGAATGVGILMIKRP